MGLFSVKKSSNNKMRLTFLFLFVVQMLFAQYAPPVGQPGTTAMYKDSTAFIDWANFCVVQRGFQDISNTSGPKATVGDSSKAIGIADNSIVSLGDAGIAICTFAQAITNAAGYDFAVFENSFSDDYLEFAFVEVSSDGINFFRFPATCNIQDTLQTGAFGLSDASLVNNLAGKYRGSYGTPFDLAELQGTSGLDIANITHVKIVDVVGSISPLYATYDKNNKKINDPWITAFASSGFDLDAVGVIHNVTISVEENDFENNFTVYPNPSNGREKIKVLGINGTQIFDCDLRIVTILGQAISPSAFGISPTGENISFEENNLQPGIYFLQIKTKNKSFTKKIIISQ